MRSHILSWLLLWVGLITTSTGGQRLHVAAEANLKLPFHEPTLINVGLPRSGTTTIHFVLLMLNVSSQHIVPSMSKDNINEFRTNFSGLMRDSYTKPTIEVCVQLMVCTTQTCVLTLLLFVA